MARLPRYLGNAIRLIISRILDPTWNHHWHCKLFVCDSSREWVCAHGMFCSGVRVLIVAWCVLVRHESTRFSHVVYCKVPTRLDSQAPIPSDSSRGVSDGHACNAVVSLTLFL